MSFYFSILGSLSTSIMVFNQNLEMYYMNESAEQLLQSSGSRLKGVPMDEILNVDLSGMKSKKLSELYDFSIDHEQKIYLYESQIYFHTSRLRKNLGCLINCINVDNEKWIVLEIFDQQGSKISPATVEQSALTKKFIRGLAHEIRNPLGGLRGAAQLLQQLLEDEEQMQYTHLIMREADRLTNLVSQMQASVSLTQATTLNIHQILEHIRQLIQSESENKLTVKTDYDPSLPEVQGNQDLLIQAFLNILRNAHYAVRNNTNDPEILIRTRIDHQVLPDCSVQQQVIRVDVLDNGEGIDKEIAAHIFEPLISTNPGGSGLGLSITFDIINNHGGLITFNDDGDMTVFSTYLKICKK